MSLFTPITGIIGGSLIGGSAGALLVLNGDIMGISGIMSNSLIDPVSSLQEPKHHWRWVFLASFSLAVNTYVNFLTPEVTLSDARSIEKDDVPIPSMLGQLIGGLLVGVGSRLQNGCTTGHGICGLARLSPRSFASVMTFMGTSMTTRFIVSPKRYWGFMTEFLRKQTLSAVSPLLSELIAGGMAIATMAKPMFGASEVDSAKGIGAALSGVLFAAGLAVSGMTTNSKVHDFLCLTNFEKGEYDPTLMAVMGSGMISSWLSYQFVKGYSSLSTNACAAIFGIGWGLTGICPGPGIYAAAAGVVDAAVAWVPGFLLGSFVGGKIAENVWEKKDDKDKKA